MRTHIINKLRKQQKLSDKKKFCSAIKGITFTTFFVNLSDLHQSLAIKSLAPEYSLNSFGLTIVGWKKNPTKNKIKPIKPK